MKNSILAIIAIVTVTVTACDNAGYATAPAEMPEQDVIHLQDTEAELALTECLDGADIESIIAADEIERLEQKLSDVESVIAGLYQQLKNEKKMIDMLNADLVECN